MPYDFKCHNTLLMKKFNRVKLTFLSHFDSLLNLSNLFNDAIFSKKGESVMSQLHVMS